MVGRPLKSREAQAEEIGTPEGLAALSLDALSSVAYGPEAIALVLVTAGPAAMRDLLPISLAIVALLAILVLSYSQVIDAYPGGGGAYTVSKQNLGVLSSHLAAAALIVDYILTVAISVAAGIAALTSAFPALLPWTVPLCLLLLAIVTFLNLRGVGESARAFLFPTMLFIVGLLAALAFGLLRPLAHHAAGALPPMAAPIGALLLLRAFAAGCTALTGVEAIANGVPLFRPPRVVRAKRTEWLLGGILAAMLLGVALLAIRFGVQPGGQETLLSRVLTAAVGRGWAYYVVSIATTAVLGLAANTSFGGLPLLASVLARDHYMPHVFSLRGDRLVFESGIWVLATAAALLLLAVQGNPQALVPMFAIGVFTGFTLSQTGMVVHWWRKRPRGWVWRAGLNALGAAATAVATLLFVLTKFLEGAWLVVLAIPVLMLLFRWTRRYYARVDTVLAPGALPPPVVPRPRPTVVVPIRPRLSTLTRRALQHALALSDDVIAVAVVFEPEDDAARQELEAAWEQWAPPVRLVTLQSQYHSVVRPLVRFINSLERKAGERLFVLIPEMVPTGRLTGLLHNRMGSLLAAALRRRTDIVIGMVPMHLEEDQRGDSP